MSTKMEYNLQGLGCANCAAKMESHIKTLPRINKAFINFGASSLAIETDIEHLEKLEEEVKKIVRKYEPHVVVSRKDARDKFTSEEGTSHSLELPIHKPALIRLAFGVAFYLAALLLSLAPAQELGLFVISYLLLGCEVVVKAFRNIIRGQLFDENFLMTIATAGAFAIQEYPEAVGVMLFYKIGTLFEDMAVNRSRRSIQALLDIKPAYANLKQGEKIIQVNPDEVAAGDNIIVKPGERVPLDGLIVEGRSLMDTSALTGESIPREVKPGEEILSGFINTSGVLLVEVTKEFGASVVARILHLVQNAAGRKAPTENFITRFARYYTPVVVAVAAALAFIPPLVIPGAAFSDWFYRALIFLVISCPCALVISIPLGFFGGIGNASRNGILVKGGSYLEALNNVDTVVFDKTGTLTKGALKVTSIVPAEGVTTEQLLETAALAETYSNHPLARSILEAYGREIPKESLDAYEEIAGQGIKVIAEGKIILAGNRKLLEDAGIFPLELRESHSGLPETTVHVAIDGQYMGCLLISDEVKEDSARALQGLKALGVKRLVMLTGDNEAAAALTAGKLMLDEYHAELLPHEKVTRLEEIYNSKGKGSLVFVGDGINDAPALARADVGVAMGALGSNAAIEAADVVIMTDEPSKLLSALRIAGKTKTIVWQNIILALGVKGVIMILGAVGAATLWGAVFADVGVAVIAILNAMRVLNFKTYDMPGRLSD